MSTEKKTEEEKRTASIAHFKISLREISENPGFTDFIIACGKHAGPGGGANPGETGGHDIARIWKFLHGARNHRKLAEEFAEVGITLNEDEADELFHRFGNLSKFHLLPIHELSHRYIEFDDPDPSGSY